ncbi:hypothetical protein LAD67_13040 [Escherichia coli]|nr:hypothetical protein [Escherichia coli]
MRRYPGYRDCLHGRLARASRCWNASDLNKRYNYATRTDATVLGLAF